MGANQRQVKRFSVVWSNKRETKMTVQKPESFIGYCDDRRNVRTPGQLVVNNHPKIFC